MFSELNSVLSRDGNGDNTDVNLKTGELFLVSEAGDAEGSFLIHHFLTQHLKCGSRVIFLGLAQSLSHYQAVTQKLGVNLTAAVASGQLEFISGLQFSQPFMKGEQCPRGKDGNEGVLSDCINSGSLQPLYTLLAGRLGEQTGSQPHLGTLLLIDDLSILHSLGIETGQIFEFIQYCQALMLPLGHIVALHHCDVPQEEEEDVVFLSNRLQHACTCHIKVEGLSSGYCKDVHGQITIVQHPKQSQNSVPTRKALQYKILDKNVSFFAAGTSSAVL